MSHVQSVYIFFKVGRPVCNGQSLLSDLGKFMED